jgi:hypothetical protein
MTMLRHCVTIVLVRTLQRQPLWALLTHAHVYGRHPASVQPRRGTAGRCHGSRGRPDAGAPAGGQERNASQQNDLYAAYPVKNRLRARWPGAMLRNRRSTHRTHGEWGQPMRTGPTAGGTQRVDAGAPVDEPWDVRVRVRLQGHNGGIRPRGRHASAGARRKGRRRPAIRVDVLAVNREQRTEKRQVRTEKGSR